MCRYPKPCNRLAVFYISDRRQITFKQLIELINVMVLVVCTRSGIVLVLTSIRASLWNSLPESLRLSSSLSSFKGSLESLYILPVLPTPTRQPGRTVPLHFSFFPSILSSFLTYINLFLFVNS
jgi:hypothetical protein